MSGIWGKFKPISKLDKPEEKAKSDRLGVLSVLVFMCCAISLAIGENCLLRYRVESSGTITNGWAISVNYNSIGRGGGWSADYIFQYKGVYYRGYTTVQKSWAQSHKAPVPLRIGFVPSNSNLNLPLDVSNIPPFWAGVLIVSVLGITASYMGFQIARISIRAYRNKKRFYHLPNFSRHA